MGVRLDKIETAISLNRTPIAPQEIAKLRQQIADLPHDSVVIREAASTLAQIEADDFWSGLDQEKIIFLQ